MTAWQFPELNYDCLQCGKSCGGWRILVDPPALQGLAAHPRVQAVRQAGYEPFVEGPDGLWRLTERGDGKCHYLREDRLCALHADSGQACKPRACRQFPFFLVETPAGTQVGLSFRCTAVQRNAGRPVSVHADELEGLRSSGHYPRLGFAEISLRFDLAIDWQTYCGLEAQMLAALQEPDLEGGLWRALAVVAGSEQSGPSELLLALRRLLAHSLIGYLETDRPEEMRSITDALQQGGRFVSRRLDQEVDAAQVRHRLDSQVDLGWLTEELRRYLTHLIVRKHLLEGDTVLARSVGLWVLYPVLRWYCGLLAVQSGNPRLERPHLERAWEIIEGEVVGHVQPLESFYQMFEQSFLTYLNS